MPNQEDLASNESFDVAVIGAGPAGLMAAIAAAQAGARVVVIEQLELPGRKLLSTGGGRCNLTNTASNDEIMSAFGRNGRFMAQALAAMDGRALRAFFDDLGVPTVCEDGFHVFPRYNRASDVLDALLKKLRQFEHVRIITGVEVKKIIQGKRHASFLGGGAPVPPPVEHTNDLDSPNTRRDRSPAARQMKNEVQGVETSGGPILAGSVVIATGGKSYPSLGATGSGFELASALGHSIAPTVPALVGLVVGEDWTRRCAGVSVRARVWIDLPRFPKAGLTGDILFTHNGLSGPAILDISGDVSALLAKRKEVPLRLALTPVLDRTRWQERLDDWGHNQGIRPVGSLLAMSMPASLAQQFCRMAGVDPAIGAAHVNRPARNAIAGLVTACPFTVTATEGFDSAIVTRGGVNLKEVDPRTLESRLVNGLYFAGEVLDLDGPCGGYNLQWAFSSGHLAGLSASEANPQIIPEKA